MIFDGVCRWFLEVMFCVESKFLDMLVSGRPLGGFWGEPRRGYVGWFRCFPVLSWGVVLGGFKWEERVVVWVVVLRSFVCPVCNFKSKRLGALKAHYTSAHGGRGSQRYYCIACGRKFSSRIALINHAIKRRDEYHVLVYYLNKRPDCRKKSNMIEVGKYVSKLIEV